MAVLIKTARYLGLAATGEYICSPGTNSISLSYPTSDPPEGVIHVKRLSPSPAVAKITVKDLIDAGGAGVAFGFTLNDGDQVEIFCAGSFSGNTINNTNLSVSGAGSGTATGPVGSAN